MIINSLLDTDLYTFTVGQAVFEHYPDQRVTYEFTNRSWKTMKFTQEAVDEIRHQINHLGNLQFNNDEVSYLVNLHYLGIKYIRCIKNLRLDPKNEVNIRLEGEELKISINGFWSKTIFYEVPILAIVSQVYFAMIEKDWNYDNQFKNAFEKSNKLAENGCKFIEFGSRRRRSFENQRDVISALKNSETFLGTSNVYFAKEFNIRAFGSQSHQWFMGVSGVEGVKHANRIASEKWDQTYQGQLSIALSDTWGTEAFFNDFNKNLTQKFDGFRHDSSDPFIFTDKVIQHYTKYGIEPLDKKILFSDSLDVEKCIKLNDYCKNKIQCSFGIGTHMTSDFKKASDPTQISKPLSIVIKLSSIHDGQRMVPVVKFSDDLEKATGDADAKAVAMWELYGKKIVT